MKRFSLVACGVAILAGVFILARSTGFSDFFTPESLKATIEAYGVFGPMIFIGLYIVACLLFFPGTPLTLLGGVLFGSFLGTMYTVVGATLGATLAFLFSRFFRGSTKSFGGGAIGAKLASYDEMIEKKGFATVLFLRFVPLFPFNGLNFALGLTGVRLRDYILGTFLGIIPGTTVFVFFGDSLAELSVVKIVGAIIGVVLLSLLGKFVLQKYGK